MSLAALNDYKRGHDCASLAYTLYNQGISGDGYMLQTKKGAYEHYKAVELRENIDGLNCHVLIPQNKSNNEFHIVFTGTQDAPAIRRDVEPGCAGCRSFAKAIDDMSQHLQEILTTHAKDQKVNLVISGHSLGGADSEALLAHLLEEKAIRNKYDQINHIELFSFSSPGLLEETVNSAEVHLKYILEKQDFGIDLHYGRSEDDLVPWFGERHMTVPYHEGKSNTDYLHITKDSSWEDTALENSGYATAYFIANTFSSHLLDWFDKDGKPCFESYEFLTAKNAGEFETLHDILHDKATFLMSLKSYFHNLLDRYKNHFKPIEQDDVFYDAQEGEPLTPVFNKHVEQSNQYVSQSLSKQLEDLTSYENTASPAA